MARNTRWTQIVHSFRAGILSPAAQDQIDGEAFLQGAARLDNLVVERDGGVAGRPAFVRSDVVVPKPRYGLLAGQSWSANSGTGGSEDSSGTFPANLYDTPGAIARFVADDGVRLRTRRTVAAQTDFDLLRIDLASGLPRSVTFHDVVLSGGSYQGTEGGQQRLNLRLVGHKRSETNPNTVVRFDADPAADEDESPVEFGKFAPGRVRRDIVVRLIPVGEPGPVDLDWIALRFTRTGAATSMRPFEISFGGVSVFADEEADADEEAVELAADFFGAPYRILEWPIRNVPHVLVLGMDWVSMQRVEGSRLVRFQGDNANTRGVWHFTERQLRELTATRFGGNLLLFHTDFPWPLEVRLTNPLEVRHLSITNLPVLTTDQQGRIAPQISDAGAIQRIAGSRFAEIVAYAAQAFPGRLRVTWESTGADEYKIYWTTRQNFLNEGGVL